MQIKYTYIIPVKIKCTSNRENRVNDMIFETGKCILMTYCLFLRIHWDPSKMASLMKNQAANAGIINRNRG